MTGIWHRVRAKIARHLANNAIIYGALLVFAGIPLIYGLLDPSQRTLLSEWINEALVVILIVLGAVCGLLIL